MYFGFGAPLNGLVCSRPQAGGAGRATLRDGGLLNRFFPFQCILTKERNALRLDDALCQGLGGEKIDSSRRPPNAAFMPTLPLHAEVTVSDSRDSKLLVWRLRRQYRLAALLWRSSGGRYFACKSGAICPKGCALTRSSLACDVGTPWQAARRPLWKACHRAHSAER